MSTKIYNGYKMRKLNTNEFFQFVAELKDIAYDFSISNTQKYFKKNARMS